MISFLLKINQSIRVILVILYVGCIATLSLLPPQDFPQIPLFEGVDKIIHFIMYSIFSLLFSWAIKTELNYSRLLLIIPVTIGWGVFMEIMQSVMHLGRSFDLHDMLANANGVGFGILIFVLIIRKYHS